MQKIDHKKTYKDQKVCVLGMGVSGRSAAKFLLKKGARVCGIDNSIDCLGEVEKDPALELKTPNSFEGLEGFDCLIVSPGISQNHPIYKEAKDLGIEVLGEIELACRSVTQPCLAVTGTNGKTTVTALIAHVLNYSGRLAHAVGNIGLPMTERVLENDGAILVVELSSYQLETLSSKVFDGGLILNISPDHLDRYSSMDEYVASKLRLQHCLKKGAPLYVDEEVMERWGDLLEEESRIFRKENIESFLPVSYRKIGGHDCTNAIAAYCLCAEYGISVEQFKAGIETFVKPPHRLELIRELEGVTYYNDSKATNVDAVKKAVETLSEAIILIAGGQEKGLSYESWVPVFKQRVKALCVIGETAQNLARDLEDGLDLKVCHCDSLEAAVKYAHQIASPGDRVLLSPGAASFDMFKNYAERGDQFRRAVLGL